MSLQKTFFKSVVWSYLQLFLSQFVNFSITLLIAHFVLPNQVGLVGLVSVFMALGTALLEGGLNNSLIINQTDAKDYSQVFYFNIFIAILVYGILFILAPSISIFYNQPLLTNIIRILGVSLLFNAAYTVHQTVLTKEFQFKKLFYISFPSLLISGIVAVYMAYKNYGVWSIVVFQLGNHFISMLLFWFFKEWQLVFSLDKTLLKKHFIFGKNLMFSNVLDIIFRNSYALVIGKIFTIAQVAFYNAANSLVMLPVSNISGAINKVALPIFSEVKDNQELLKKTYQKIQLMVLFLIIPIVFLMFYLAETIVAVLYNKNWAPMVLVFQILSLTGILYPLHYFNILILQIKNRTDLYLYLEIAKKVVQLSILVVSLYYGFYALLWGQVVFSIIALFINSYFTGKYLQYSLVQQLQDAFPVVVSSTITIGTVYWVFKWVVIQNLCLKVIVISSLTILLYFIISKILKVRSFLDIQDIIKSMVKNK
jgi:teichuronic acid exporter